MRFAAKRCRKGLPTRSTDAALRQNTGACQWKLIAIAFCGAELRRVILDKQVSEFRSADRPDAIACYPK